MRAALVFVALACMVAMVAAQAGTYTFKGTYYTDTACSASTSYAITATYTYSTTPTYSCGVAGSGSTAIAYEGYCFNYSVSGVSFQSWYVYAYVGGTCASSGTGVPTGTGTNYGFAYGTDFSTCETLGTGVGSVKPSSCSSGASTLIVPSFLLAALAFVASKLQL